MFASPVWDLKEWVASRPVIDFGNHPLLDLLSLKENLTCNMHVV